MNFISTVNFKQKNQYHQLELRKCVISSSMVHHHVLFYEADLPEGTEDTDNTVKITRLSEHYLLVVILQN